MWRCDCLTDIEIPETVKSIGDMSFSRCSSLDSITLPESVESVGNEAFSECEKLESVTIENPLCKIFGSDKTIPSTAVIYCPKGAAAQDYIDSFSREYKIIGEPEFVAGDVNEDSVVDSSDASLILVEYSRVQTGGETIMSDIQKKSADINDDNIIDSSDASKVLEYYSKISTGHL